MDLPSIFHNPAMKIQRKISDHAIGTYDVASGANYLEVHLPRPCPRLWKRHIHDLIFYSNAYLVPSSLPRGLKSFPRMANSMLWSDSYSREKRAHLELPPSGGKHDRISLKDSSVDHFNTIFIKSGLRKEGWGRQRRLNQISMNHNPTYLITCFDLYFPAAYEVGGPDIDICERSIARS